MLEVLMNESLNDIDNEFSFTLKQSNRKHDEVFIRKTYIKKLIKIQIFQYLNLYGFSQTKILVNGISFDDTLKQFC